MMIRLDTDEREALLSDGRGWVPGYLGPSGWLGIDIVQKTDWEEVAELIESSYRETASPHLVEVLGERWRR